MLSKIVIVLAVFCGGLLACTAGTLVQFRTTLGDIEIELYDQEKPVTVTNFLYYVKQGYTNNMIIHRLVPTFVIQGGLAFVSNKETAPIINYIPTKPAITNEFSVGKKLSNTNGTIAMARVGGITNSATSQWYINLGNNSVLDNVDGGFTVFGRVLRGYNVLNLFSSTSPQVVWSYNFGTPFSDLPATVDSASKVNVNNLIYVDITLLNVRISDIISGKQITWRSVKDKINYLEYTTVFPPSWQTLATPTGTGNDMSVTDTSGDTKRFYRIRVDYP